MPTLTEPKTLNLVEEIFARRKCELCGELILKTEYDFNKGICHPCRREIEIEPLPDNDDDNEWELLCEMPNCYDELCSDMEIEMRMCDYHIQESQMEDEHEHPDQKAREGKRIWE